MITQKVLSLNLFMWVAAILLFRISLVWLFFCQQRLRDRITETEDTVVQVSSHFEFKMAVWNENWRVWLFMCRNGQRLVTDSRVHFDAYGYLSIKQVRVSDAGEYTCRAQNLAGHATHKFHFSVKGCLASE